MARSESFNVIHETLTASGGTNAELSGSDARKQQIADVVRQGGCWIVESAIDRSTPESLEQVTSGAATYGDILRARRETPPPFIEPYDLPALFGPSSESYTGPERRIADTEAVIVHLQPSVPQTSMAPLHSETA
ncbi:MAG TPA: hypothetical protein VK983_00040 [Candidatus Limnocylindrales bacterium]|nr:hypothetical protein [Candidatus Limnocylindrales bacterium]